MTNNHYYSCIMCITNWGAILKVGHISGRQIAVSDPDCRDAGMVIFDDEIRCMWKIVLLEPHKQGYWTPREWSKIKQIF